MLMQLGDTMSDDSQTPDEWAAAEKQVIAAQRDAMERLFDKSMSYSNLMVAAGYAGAFSAWSTTSPKLSDTANAVIGLCLGISLLIFIFFEIFKMVSNAWFFVSKSTVYFRWFWFVVLFITTTTAAAALGLLLYNYIAVLANLPKWPS